MRVWLLCIIAVVMAEWAIELDPNVDPAAFALEHDMILQKKSLDYAPNVHFFESSKKRSHIGVRSLPGVVQAEEQVVRRHYTRSQQPIPDPLYQSKITGKYK